MSARLPGAIVGLLGAATLWLATTGRYLRYVRPGLFWPLVAAGVICLLAAVAVFVRHDDVDAAGHASGDDGHRGTAWLAVLLALPVVTVVVLRPPPLGVAAALVRSAQAPRTPFGAPDPVPPWPDPAPLTLDGFLERAGWHDGTLLRGRRVRLTAFVMRRGGAVLLSRFAIVCCAADAELEQVQVARATPLTERDGTWIAVTGTLVPATARAAVPTLAVTDVDHVTTPVDTYEYPS